jgi:hypothetical protein
VTRHARPAPAGPPVPAMRHRRAAERPAAPRPAPSNPGCGCAAPAAAPRLSCGRGQSARGGRDGGAGGEGRTRPPPAHPAHDAATARFNPWRSDDGVQIQRLCACFYIRRTPPQAGRSISLVEGLLLVGRDGHVGGGVGHAGQHEAVAHLGVVQEGLVGLVHGAGLHLAGAAGAGACAWSGEGTGAGGVGAGAWGGQRGRQGARAQPPERGVGRAQAGAGSARARRGAGARVVRAARAAIAGRGDADGASRRRKRARPRSPGGPGAEGAPKDLGPRRQRGPGRAPAASQAAFATGDRPGGGGRAPMGGGAVIWGPHPRGRSRAGPGRPPRRRPGCRCPRGTRWSWCLRRWGRVAGGGGGSVPQRGEGPGRLNPRAPPFMRQRKGRLAGLRHRGAAPIGRPARQRAGGAMRDQPPTPPRPASSPEGVFSVTL